jgi:hypothetical protein
LTLREAKGSCIAWASLKTEAPKLSAALILLWLLSLYQDKESNKDFGRTKKEKKKSKKFVEQKMSYLCFRLKI